VSQATTYAGVVQKGIESGEWEKKLQENKYVGPWVKRLSDLSKPSNDEKQNDGSPDDQQKTNPDDAPKNDAPAEPTPEPESSQPAPAKPDTETDRDQSSKDNSTSEASAPAEDAPDEGGFNWSVFGMPSSSSLASAARSFTSRVGSLMTGLGWVGMQLLITMMCLFFFLRDRHSVLGGLQNLMPLSKTESERIFRRVNDTIHATIFGSLTVALVQGFMGGLMFWFLGLPSPLFWGALMGLLAVVPVLGTFVIWAPTAAWLALQGDWTKAIILVSWGAIAIGLIDNLLYPFLVGNRMRFHTLLVFFSIVGGLSVFGAAGIILGPVLLAVADGLMQIWHARIDRARQSA
jgi:predicted PurR-regulated permease PerM